MSDRTCDECGGANPIWFAPNSLWNRVKGGPDATDDPAGVLCPLCFMAGGDKELGEQVWLVDQASTRSSRTSVVADDLLRALKAARTYIGNPARSGLARDRVRDGLIDKIDRAITCATTPEDGGACG